MKSYIIVAALSVLTGGLSAQTSIEDVLRSVEANNKDLQANSQLGPVAEAGGEVG